MNVLFICRNFNRKRGGFEEHILRIIKGIEENGYGYILLTTNIKEPFRIKNMIIIDAYNLFGYAYSPKLTKILLKIKNNIDIVHVQGWGSYIIETSLNFFSGKKPLLLTPHQFFHKQSFFKSLYNIVQKKRVLKKPDVVIALTHSQKKEIKKYTRKVITIPNGIDVSEFKEIEYKDEGYIISVGRLEKYKGFETVLNLGKDLRKKVIIVGRKTPYYHVLKRKIKKEEIKAKIYTNVSRKSLINLLSRASLFVNASLSEGFGIALLEALACGVPIVSTPVGIAPELPSTFVKICKNYDEFKIYAENFFGKKRKIFKKARKFVFKNFSWKKIINLYIDLYKKLLEQ